MNVVEMAALARRRLTLVLAPREEGPYEHVANLIQVLLGAEAGAYSVTWGGAINFQKGEDLSRTDPQFIAVLAHELTHVVQWLSNPIGYDLSMIGTWLWAGTLGRLFGADPYRLPDGWESRPFSSFSREQQGEIVQRCYAGSATACGVSPYHP